MIAQLSAQLWFRDVSNAGTLWKPLRWSDLGEMHGRRIHISAVATDLQAAWHVHPPEELAGEEERFPFQLRLPPGNESAAVRARFLFNFGVRADARTVDMCVSEKSVHIDPQPGREMLVEGEARTGLEGAGWRVGVVKEGAKKKVRPRKKQCRNGLGRKAPKKAKGSKKRKKKKTTRTKWRGKKRQENLRRIKKKELNFKNSRM